MPKLWRWIDGGAIYRNILSTLREFHRAKIVMPPVWCSRLKPTTGVHLAHCHDEFRGPRSMSDRWHEQQQQAALELLATDQWRNVHPHKPLIMGGGL
ncbi:hypothetical protein TNCV_4859031 [Trichonephila clavipes]|nr:hypothetical protein TNCV_4859031 [Trichonephila clavipes]